MPVHKKTIKKIKKFVKKTVKKLNPFRTVRKAISGAKKKRARKPQRVKAVRARRRPSRSRRA